MTYCISKGERYPFDLVVGADDRIGLNLRCGYPTYEIVLKKPYDGECLDLDGLCKVITILYHKDHYPYGLLGAVFGSGEGKGQWYLRAPLCASQEQVREWVSADTNIVMFVLIDADTGIVANLRTIGLNDEILAQLKLIWGGIDHGDKSVACFNSLVDSISQNELFSVSRRWVYDASEDDFIES
jgi:hypothetical protein